MSSKQRAGLVFIMVLIMMAIDFPLPQVKAEEENQTIRIDRSSDDGFVTEAGNMFVDTSLVHVSDPGMRIYGFLVFREININRWETLTNATLRLSTATDLPEAPDNLFFIYGVKTSNFIDFRTAAEVTSAPRTSQIVGVNSSDFSGGAWFEFDVTYIIEELIRRPTWDGDQLFDGENIGFILSSAFGETRYFYDKQMGNGREAQLVIHWGDIPDLPEPPPEDPPLPPDDPDPVYNETYRNYTIWEVNHTTTNRTGAGVYVDWSNLNLTALSEIDSGLVLEVHNDTWATTTNQVAQQHVTLWNDTGSPANITSYFVRFAINVTMVNNLPGGGSDQITSPVSLSSATPTGGGGLYDGGSGNWCGVLMWVDEDDDRYLLRLVDRTGALKDFGPGTTGYYSVTDQEIIYCEFYYNDTFYSLRTFTDDQFTNQDKYLSHSFGQASPPFRYPQVLSSLGFGQSRASLEFYTYSNFTLPTNSTWYVADENGTIVGYADDYDDALVIIDDLMGGPDPEEPNPPGQGWEEEGPFTRFRTRLYILALGVMLIFGPLMFWASSRPSGYEFVIGAFLMLIGYALMLAAGQV